MSGNRLFSLAALLLALPLLAGCWDRREMNELAISVAMGIDKIGDQYQVAVQVVQPGEVAADKGGGGGASPVTVYKAKGVTLFEAIRRLTTVSPRKIYGAHLRIAVFGEELAREGLGDALDLLSRDYELRTDFYMLIAQGSSASDMLDILTPLDKIPANKVFGSLTTSEKVWAPVMTVTLDELIKDIASSGKHPVLSGITAVGDREIGKTLGNVGRTRSAAHLRNTDMAVFRDDKLIGWLNETESKGYNYILGNVTSTVGHIECPEGGHAALEVVASDAKLSGRVKNGRPALAVRIDVEENVGEVQCRIDLTKQETIRELERRAKGLLTRLVSRAIEKAQKQYKADIFGFGSAVHRSNPRAWRTMRKDWDERFGQASIDIDIQVKIRRVGTMTNRFEKKERG